MAGLYKEAWGYRSERSRGASRSVFKFKTLGATVAKEKTDFTESASSLRGGTTHSAFTNTTGYHCRSPGMSGNVDRGKTLAGEKKPGKVRLHIHTGRGFEQCDAGVRDSLIH